MFRNSDFNFSEEYFECETNGVISESIVQNWTKQALDCYKINSDCKNCPITHAHYSFKCQMKNIVAILLKTKGLPDEKAIISRMSQEEENKEDIVA